MSNSAGMNAYLNLRYFGHCLGLSELEYDDVNTCILGIDDEFSLHLTYDPQTTDLYLYSPIADGLPENPSVRLMLFETLLEGTMLGIKMAGGGIGVDFTSQLILLHCVLPMESASEDALTLLAPTFIEAVKKWTRIAFDISQIPFYNQRQLSCSLQNLCWLSIVSNRISFAPFLPEPVISSQLSWIQQSSSPLIAQLLTNITRSS